jgi:ribonuclease P protein component
MLSRENRVNNTNDFKLIMRKGRTFKTEHFIVSVLKSDGPTSFGYIVSKTVGNSVVRHSVTRRLREISRDFIATHPTGHKVIIRALADSDALDFTILTAEVTTALNKLTKKNK